MRNVLLGFIAGAAAASAVAVAAAQIAPGTAVRRVVTKLDASGKAVVMFDDRIEMSKVRPPNGVADIWLTRKSPADLSGTDDRAKLIKSLAPPKGGTSFRIVEFVPEGPEISKLAVDHMMRIVGAEAPAKGMPPKHPMMHRTRTVDYVLVLSGEIDMLLDDSEVHLEAGDVMVQQATNHAWVNRGKEPCRVAFILMDSDEPS